MSEDNKVDRYSIVLAGLAPASGGAHTPVQVQKLFFLIDRSIPNLVGGPFFDFEPYDYGPFDSFVYSILERLRNEGLVEIESGPVRRYRLTDEGQVRGHECLECLDPEAQDFIRRASKFVRSLPFEQLVASIYKAFPDMKVNSVFKTAR